MLALVALAAAVVQPIAPATFVAWRPADGVRRFRSGGVTVTVDPNGCHPVDRFSDCTPAVTVAASGVSQVMLPKVGGIAFRVAIGRLERQTSRPGVIVDTYTGGAHCCHRFTIAYPVGRRFRTYTVSRQDPWSGTIRDFDVGEVPFPTDRTGNGRVDFVLRDDSFLYAFTDYAESMAPPLVLEPGPEGTTDVSRSSSLGPVFRADMAKVRRYCVDPGDRDPNGACAAYAGDAARLGRLANAWPEIVRNYQRKTDFPYTQCRVHLVGGHCPEGQTQSFAGYPQALRAFLTRQGYIAHP